MEAGGRAVCYSLNHNLMLRFDEFPEHALASEAASVFLRLCDLLRQRML